MPFHPPEPSPAGSPPVDPFPADVVERARHGDPLAFDAVVEHYAPPLVKFLTGVLSGDFHAAHDVAQDAFLATWRALPGLEEPRRLKAWLYRTAWHMAMSWRRRRGPAGAPIRTFGSLDYPNGDPADFAGPEHATRRWPLRTGWATTEEAAPHLRALLVSLPGRYAAPLTLYYFQGLSILQTAEALGVPGTTIKMRLHRARCLMREQLLGKKRSAPPGRRPATSRRDPRRLP